jgi:SAM-dependent methyltransferase
MARREENAMAFEALKARHGVIWGSGPYERISEHPAIAHDHLLRAVEARPGERRLDVATGTGEIAVPRGRARLPRDRDRHRARADRDGARAGPRRRGRRRARGRGRRAAAPSGRAFDVVVSAFGVMFAPDQRAVATELARVTRPAGRLALLNWHPARGVAEFFKVLAPYLPPPEGARNPFAWGATTGSSSCSATPSSWATTRVPVPSRELGRARMGAVTTAYGPTKALADSLDTERRRHCDAHAECLITVASKGPLSRPVHLSFRASTPEASP